MLIFVVLFAHALIRLSILLVRLHRNGGLTDPSDNDPEAFAQVSDPIRVVLQRDEELGLSGYQAPENDKSMPAPPPSYGRWRGSVRVDPNLIHWQRNETNQRPLSEGTLRRPPSYVDEEQEEEGPHPQSNDDDLSEKPIRPRTPPVETESESSRARQRTTILLQPPEVWVPPVPLGRQEQQQRQ